MKTLNIENLPDELYRNLQNLAAARKLTLNETALYLLQQAFQFHELQDQPMSAILGKIRSRPRVNPNSLGLLDSTMLIREDRDR
ncbi:hypothetical protein [Oscillatoria sp. FACHB-1406]|uniref:hypothetical protein n=1 Tax=Oscillatoria sp. FACHB-1406 TaxID=2692846 RepID=UPI00168747EE|nr:hypothetical protein [Oscillatoria sp. FACHB-1406]MBD2579904.1 hypothetical protein [Oscillatoria sp. FACHB-1406]